MKRKFHHPNRPISKRRSGPVKEARPRANVLARVMVAPGNADMRDHLSRVLGRMYELTYLKNGRAALEKIQPEPPDVTLIDVTTAASEGFALLAAIRADERTRTMPVIMLSAKADEPSRIKGLAAGANDYLITPFSAADLVSRISSQLELSRVRREAEQALRYRSEQFETLLNQAPLGVYLIDADFRIRAVNPVALPVFGDIPGGVVGRDFDEIIHLLWEQEYADEIVRIFRYTLKTGEPYITPERAEFRIDRGITEYYEWRLNRITLPDGRYGLVCYFRDISAQVRARKAAEESRVALEEADKRKDEFLATLAHELRNPLAPILNSLSILRMGELDRATAERVHAMVDRQLHHMIRLVDDLMEVSRISRGKIELRKEPVNLADIVKSAIETSRPLIDAAGHELNVILPNEPLILNADRVRIAQVLSNLLNNATKYTAERGKISLIARKERSQIAITVRDNGVGIPAEMIAKIFDIFVQVENTHSRSQGGLGIGLTLVRSLVEMHGGSVEAKSEGPHRGSEFTVRLPAAPAIRKRTHARDESKANLAHRILVVDDNRDAADSLGILLRSLGADLQTAYTGPEGLDMLRTFKPTVVLLDIGMPAMDGYEFARRARKKMRGRDVTLVALTGWGQEDHRRKSKDAGIDHHLVKPVHIETLRKLLTSLSP